MLISFMKLCFFFVNIYNLLAAGCCPPLLLHNTKLDSLRTTKYPVLVHAVKFILKNILVYVRNFGFSFQSDKQTFMFYLIKTEVPIYLSWLD